MADSLAAPGSKDPAAGVDSDRFTHPLLLIAFGAAIFLGTLWAPPSLMDDVDAVNAQIARTMMESGDWVTARVNGVAYLEKSPLGFWMMAWSYAVFGVHDWAARLPTRLGAIALMGMTMALGAWGFGRRAGFYAGLAVGTSIGLFLFTRTVIPDVLLTLAITAALYCFLRAVEPDPPSPNPRPPTPILWPLGFWACLGIGLLLKGLLAVVVPVATAALYLLFTRRLLSRQTWRALRPFAGILLALAIYMPWVVLATVRNPPLFDFTLRSDPGVYRGFFWFYFINEHVLRFLGLRYPRDYDTVPRLVFLLLHVVWLFPWSAFWPAALRSWPAPLHPRGARLRLLCAIWILFLLAFLSLSTTQEYYSMPCYPALAILAGAALASGPSRWISAGYGTLAALGIVAGTAAAVIVYKIRGVPANGDISSALTANPEAYTLALGHLRDLTLASFAWLRWPLLVAGLALALGTVAAWLARRGPLAPLFLAAAMTLCTYAARAAMAVFDPYLSSRHLAEAIARGPQGQLIIAGHYYPASSVVFYTNRPALLLHGKVDNLVYGAAAPDCPPVFLEDADLARLWSESQRLYLVASSESRTRLQKLLGTVYLFAEAGGKCVLTNRR